MDENAEVLTLLHRIEQRLLAVERWLRFSNMDKLRDILSHELGDDDRKKLAYECSDGSRGYREVGQMAAVAGPTVQGWWGRWFAIGIMEASPNRTGRVQRICSLREVGLDVPTARVNQKKGKGKSRSMGAAEEFQD